MPKCPDFPVISARLTLARGGEARSTIKVVKERITATSGREYSFWKKGFNGMVSKWGEERARFAEKVEDSQEKCLSENEIRVYYQGVNAARERGGGAHGARRDWGFPVRG